MRAYADSSYLVRLIGKEARSEEAISEYRRLGLPRLYYLPLHSLEVENAIRQRVHHQKQTLPSRERRQIMRQRDEVISRLSRLLARKHFLEVMIDWDATVTRARKLSEGYTEQFGARSFDLLHVAFALELKCEVFFTTDSRQAQIARAEGLKVVST